jgi:hypothetical protein
MLLRPREAKILARGPGNSPPGIAAFAGFVAAVLLAGAAWGAELRPEEIVTVLPKDAIPAILSPTFDQGGKISWLKGKELVVGVDIGGDSRAYPVPMLSRHEIVNDKVGAIPIAVTW